MDSRPPDGGRPWTTALALVVAAVLAPAAAAGRQDAPPPPVQIPADATEIEGIPTVRVDSTPDATTRRTLEGDDALREALRIRVRNGRYYWASRGDRALELSAGDGFVYLSADPGSYIRFTRINDRLSYVEHVESKEFGSTTWWGELRIVLPGGSGR